LKEKVFSSGSGGFFLVIFNPEALLERGWS
jgi:hypothetical protein